jgi:hypothetical protein
VKLTAFVAALLLGTTAMAQTAQDDARMKAAAAAPAAPAAPAAAAPAPAPAAPAFKFQMKGFVSMSAAYQTGTFSLSEGQQSLMSTTGASPVPDKDSMTFDVRQSRFNFSVSGPQVLRGATPSAVLEIDFFQGFGAGNFGDVSLLNRLRLAYSELNWGNHRLQFGQQNDLIFAMAPTSLSHIGFPLGYFTGNLGWRRPGIFGFHVFPVSSDLKLEGAWEVGRSQWADSAACVANPAAATSCSGIGGGAAGTGGGINWGEASSAPAVEGRVSATYSKYLTAFVGAHWNQVDLSGYGSGASTAGDPTVKTINVVAYNAGAKFTYGLSSGMSLTLAATGFTGQNVYPLVANFTTGNAPNATTNFGTFRLGFNGEDINTMGYWAQGGFNVTKELSLWAFYGQQKIDEKDLVRSFGASATAAVTATAFENATTNVILMYRDGGYGLSAEWINFATKYGSAVDRTAAAPGTKFTTTRTAKSDQYMLTANYFF